MPALNNFYYAAVERIKESEGHYTHKKQKGEERDVMSRRQRILEFSATSAIIRDGRALF